MSNNIDIKFTVDDAAAFRAWQRQQTQLEKMKAKLDALKGSGNTAGKELMNAASSAGRTALTAVAALTGIGGAVSALQMVAEQLKKEVANIRAVQSQAGNTQSDLGDKLLGMIRKFGTSMQPMQLRSQVLQIAERSGQDPGKVARAAENAAAASGPQTNEEAGRVLQATEAVLTFYPELDEDATALVAKSTLDLMNRFNMSASLALGFMQKLDQAHHSTGALDLATHGVPAVSAVAAFGGSAEESAALAAAMSQAMMDEGAESGTVVTKLAQELRERLPEATTGLTTTKQRIDYLRANPEEAQAYLDGGMIAGKKHNPADFGRGKGRTYVEGLIGRNAETASVYDNYVGITGDMGNRESQLAAHQSGLEATQALPEVQQSELRRRMKSASAGVQLATMQGGTAGITRDGLAQLLKDSGLSDIEQQMQMVEFEWNTALGGKMPVDEAARQLQERAADLEAPMVDEYGPAIGGGPSITRKRDPSKATNEDKVVAKRLRLAAESMRLREEDRRRKQEEAIKNDLQPAPQQVVPVAPGANRGKATRSYSTEERKALLAEAVQGRNDLLQLSSEIENDTDFTPTERKAAQERMKRAQAAGQSVSAPGAANPFSAPVIEMLNDQIRNLVETNQKLMDKLDKNTQATEQNTAAPTPATTGNPPRPRNNQASRGLSRGSPLVGGMS